jgi:hypothetical protein
MISSILLPDSLEFVSKPDFCILTKSLGSVELANPKGCMIHGETLGFLEKRKKPKLSLRDKPWLFRFVRRKSLDRQTTWPVAG